MPYGVHNNGFHCSDLNADGTEVETNIIFVGGLPPNCTKQAVEAFFRKHGSIKECSVVQKGRSPALAFVHFDAASSADAIVSMGMHQVCGRWVEVRKAVPQSKAPPVALTSGSAPSRSEFSREDFRAEMLRRQQERENNKRQKSSSSSSSSSSDSSRKKKNTKKQKRKRSRSSSTLSSSSARPTKKAASAEAALERESKTADPEVDAAKREVLQRLMALKAVQPSDARMREWRLLLREWHPDKNPERVELATAVFQFLQKGRSILEPD